jgi:hypothetical protein
MTTNAGLARLSGLLLLTAVAANLTAFGVGMSRGLMPPPAFDFGDAHHLSRLSAESTSHLLPLVLSLLSPVLAIPAGLGLFHILKPAGWPALFGTVMFFVGMVFVVLLDVLELVAIARVAPDFGTAADFARPSIQALGGAIDALIDVLGYVGHFFSFALAQLAFGFSILRVDRVPNWLGWLAFIPAIAIGWLVPIVVLAGARPAALAGIGIMAFVIWLIGMAIVLLKYRD